MSKKNTCPAAGTVRQANMESSMEHCTPDNKTAQGFIEILLPEGSEFAVSMDDLKKMTGLSRQGVINEIERERQRGTPILSSCQHVGYFLPSDGAQGRQEALECVRTLRARGLNTLRTAARIAKAAHLDTDEIPGQIHFDNMR